MSIIKIISLNVTSQSPKVDDATSYTDNRSRLFHKNTSAI